MSILRFTWDYLVSAGGLGGAVALAAVAVAILLPVFRQPAIIVAVSASVSVATYSAGRYDERGYYKQKLNREIKHASKTGDRARVRALERFDQSIDLPDDGFRRDDDDAGGEP